MPIYALGDLEPDIHPDAYVHPDAVVIDNVTIGAHSSVDSGAIVAAGAVLSPNTHVPARWMALGVPARVREGYLVPEGAFASAAESYVQRGKWFRAELRRLDAAAYRGGAEA